MLLLLLFLCVYMLLLKFMVFEKEKRRLHKCLVTITVACSTTSGNEDLNCSAKILDNYFSHHFGEEVQGRNVIVVHVLSITTTIIADVVICSISCLMFFSLWLSFFYFILPNNGLLLPYYELFTM
mmetsp:Transcript_47100/g.68814  ORF Transcript_47100/g.68814 Transcript_47100/m.68814 type:complete len:125 (+) Transcript_47100:21-395(+)